jgi:hypothetical protein
MIKKSLLFLTMLFVFSFSGKAQIVVENSSSGIGEDVSSLSVSHTVANNNNRLLLVGISLKRNKSDATVTSVNYGSQPMSQVGTEEIDDDGDEGRMYIYRLTAPNVGTANVVANFSDDPDKGVVVGVTSFSGVEQSNPLGAFFSNAGDKSDPILSGIVSAPDEIVYDVLAFKDKSATISSADGGQTIRYNRDSGDEIKGAASTKIGSASTTVGWNPTDDKKWALGAVSVKPLLCPIQADVIVTNFSASCGVSTGSITVTNPTGSSLGNYQYRLGSGTWQSSNTFTGLAAGSYAVFARDTNDISCEVSLSTVSISAVIDNDCDGIANNIDEDDDNDGIPDSVECDVEDIITINNSLIANGEFNQPNGNPYVGLNADTNFAPAPWGTFDTPDLSTDTQIGFQGNETLRANLPGFQSSPTGGSFMGFRDDEGVFGDIIINDPDEELTVRFAYTEYRSPGTSGGNPIDVDIVFRFNSVSTVTGQAIGIVPNLADSGGTPGTWETRAFTFTPSDLGVSTAGTFNIFIGSNITGLREIWAFVDNFVIIETSNIPCPDTDGDGVPDSLDLDSDNDGITDIIEAGGVDTNNDGRVDDNTDTDGDGIANTFDTDNGGAALDDFDSDGDNINDRLDLDSDNDGIPDNVEAQSTAGYIALANDNAATYEANNGVNTVYISTLIIPVDTDGDGTADYLDEDSDNDGLTDNAESFSTAPAGVVGTNGLIADAEPDDDFALETINGNAYVSGSFELLDTGNLVQTNGIDYDYRRDLDGTSLFGTRIISSLQNGTVVPNKIDAYLNIVSNNWGVVITRVAGTGVIANHEEGMLVFDTSDGTFKVCTQGGATPIWRALGNDN